MVDAPNSAKIRVAAARSANPNLSDEEVRAIAAAEFDEAAAPLNQAWSRAGEVRRAIAVACASEQLTSFVHWQHSGEFSPLDPAMWRSDVLSPRFLLGRINLQNARDKSYASKHHYVVFIGEECLGAYLLEQPHNKPDEALLPEHLSPYLNACSPLPGSLISRPRISRRKLPWKRP